ncbi:MAG: hypothetical protein N2450_05400 [bacterium]|nr:hypothetical protein [bacterium]
MELIPLLSTIIFLITLITFIVAIVSYIVFRMKERRKATARPSAPAQPTQPPNLSGGMQYPSNETVQHSNPNPVVPPKIVPIPTPPPTNQEQQNYPSNYQPMNTTGSYPTQTVRQPQVPPMQVPPPVQPPQMIVPPPPQPTMEPQLTSAQAAFLQSFTGEKVPLRETPLEEPMESQSTMQPRRFVLPGNKMQQTKSNHPPSEPENGGVLSWK